MSGRLRFSHVLIRVDDLHAAVADYAALGFQCVWGSLPGKAHNALIYFEDGPFLELFVAPRVNAVRAAVMRPLVGAATVARVTRWGSGPEGPIEFALETDDPDLKAASAACRAAGEPLGKSFGTSRVRPDGVRLTWRIAGPATVDLPFVMSAYQPPDTQPPEVRRHANGATRMAGLELIHPEPVGLRTRLAILMGEDPALQGFTFSKGKAYRLGALSLQGLSGEIPPGEARGAVFRPA